MKRFLLSLLLLVLFTVNAVAGVIMSPQMFQAFDDNGDPLNGGLLYSYIGGTTTAKSLYTDKACTVADTNPVVLDSRGEAEIYGTFGLYKLVLKDSSGTTIWTIDNIQIANNADEYLYFPDPTQSDQMASTAAGTTIYDILVAQGTSKYITIVLVNTGTSTNYTCSTTRDLSSYTKATLKIQNGAMLVDSGNPDLTWGGKINALPTQQIAVWDGSGNLYFDPTPNTSIMWTGAVGDNSTDNSAAIQRCLDASNTAFFPPVGIFKFSTTINLDEDDKVWGVGKSRGAEAYYSSASYTGSGDAFSIDGEVGVTLKRNIVIRDLNIVTTASADSGIFAEYMTHSIIQNVHIAGGCNICLEMNNSFNNKIIDCYFANGVAGNMQMIVKDDAVENVFTGQTLISNCDFWSSTAGYGLQIVRYYNVLAQVQIEKCHFKSNKYGYYHGDGTDGGGVVDFYTAHFEGNTTNDILTTPGEDDPRIHSFHCNNGSETDSNFKFLGDNGLISNGKFTGTDDGYSCIELGDGTAGYGDFAKVKNIYIRQSSGDTLKGIEVNADYCDISDILFYDADGADIDGLDINATALLTTVSNIRQDNVTGSYITDGGSGTRFTDAIIVSSPELDLVSGSGQKYGWYSDVGGYISRIWLTYGAAASAQDTTQAVIGVGTSTGVAGNESLGTFINGYATADAQSKWTQVDLGGSLAAYYLTPGYTLLFYTDGGGTDSGVAAGTARIFVELTPYRGVN